ncbi:MAG: toll/interleukin-1 receptor domain-containing protein [Deltaproteobacteria bacterium]|nr:toll/interleukin-1 receptor domain-containing protein [Deltaproteobacteria bacterium]
MIHQVFISYASRDAVTAQAVCQILEAQGVRCWIAPRDVNPGQEYAADIVQAIEECRLFLLILSSASIGSPHVVREVERAVAKSRPVLSVRVEDVALTKTMEYFLSSHHWFDASSGRLTDHLANLADKVRPQISSRPVRLRLQPRGQP